LYELSEEAAQDLLDILLESNEHWGEVTARRTAARLERRFEDIATGRAAGHRRVDVPDDLDLKFVVERPFVIAFDTATRRIVRVLYGAQDFPRVFRDRR
jgi:plasmid stabilization system protein ParE